MSQRLLVPLLLILLAGCSVNNGSLGVAASTGDSDYSSTDEYDVKVTQTAFPLSFPKADNGKLDVSFEIEFTNRSNKPVMIERISLQSMGGTLYRLETSSRKYERVVAPGAKTLFKYWAPAQVEGTTFDARAPMVVRTLIDTIVEGERLHEIFNREVNPGVAIGVGSRVGRT